MHRIHLPLRTCFLAVCLRATHSNGVSALQVLAKLRIGSYKANWLLLHKLRQAMVDAESDPLKGMVRIDKTIVVKRTKDDPVAGNFGRSDDGKALVVGALECREGGKAGRIRLWIVDGFAARTLHSFVASPTITGSTTVTEGLTSYKR